MYKTTACLCIIFFFVSSTSFAANDLPYKEDQILVRFSSKSGGIQRTALERNQILAAVDAGTVKHSFKLVPGLTVVKLPENLSVTDAVSLLKDRPEILYAEPDYKIKLLSTFPNDEYFSNQWALHNPGGQYHTEDADINAPEAWDFVTHSNIIVAVIDTGVDYNHLDLAANIWINPGEDHPPLGVVGPEDFNGVDDDGNGYIDDIRGWNFDPDANDNDPMDLLGHGTHIAGIIGAVGNNGEGVTGVCWDVKLMAVNISEYDDETWTVFASSAIKGIYYAVENGAKVINASWGGNTHIQSLEDAIEAANTGGILFIASAGNDSLSTDDFPHYPSSYDCNNIISVLATNSDDELSYYSSWGQTTVDLGAPGGDYYFDWLSRLIYSTHPGGGYYWRQGTSMAAPHVAGACALVWSAHPNLTHLQVKDIILNSVDELAVLDGNCVTGGRLNLYNAVNYLPMPYFDINDNSTGCVSPTDIINYTIHYDPCGNTDTNVFIISELPAGVDYFSSSGGGSYDPNEHTVTWTINPFGPYNPGSRYLTVTVNQEAEPGGTLINSCRLQGDNYLLIDSETTDVCCWKHIVYVDGDADPNGDGLSWNTAFNDINTAVDFAAGHECYDTVYVAAGTYQPVNDTGISGWYNYSFELADGVALFGHFEGTENNPSERQLSNPAYATILQGEIEPGDNVYYLVTADGITVALLDGFTITGAQYYGISLDDDADIAMANCKIRNNNEVGLAIFDDSNADIHNCLFNSNNQRHISSFGSGNRSCYISFCIFDGNDTAYEGIDAAASTVSVSDSTFTGFYNYAISMSGGDLTLSDSTIIGSTYDSWGGISLSNSTATIKNCLIDSIASGYYNTGIGTDGCTSITIEDCSITNWPYCGIISYDTDDLYVRHSEITGNKWQGIYCSNSRLTVNRSIIADNSQEGISMWAPRLSSITNCWIYENYTGLDFDYNSYTHNVRNNTIAYNDNYGVRSSGTAPSITNCIIWNNSTELDDCSATYSCIKNGGGGTNIESDPCFYNDASHDYHLTGDSLCIDYRQVTYPGEKDFDGEDRTINDATDIGADEYYWPKADYDKDWIVNFFDYSFFANNWLDVNEDISLDDDNDVDVCDLAFFCEDWLWEAPWGDGFSFFSMGGGFGDGLFMSEELFTTGELMFSDAEQSFAAMPQRVAEKAQKYYAVSAAQPVYISPQQRAAAVADMLTWLDKVWLNGDLEQKLTYGQYLAFRSTLLLFTKQGY